MSALCFSGTTLAPWPLWQWLVYNQLHMYRQWIRSRSSLPTFSGVPPPQKTGTVQGGAVFPRQTFWGNHISKFGDQVGSSQHAGRYSIIPPVLEEHTKERLHKKYFSQATVLPGNLLNITSLQPLVLLMERKFNSSIDHRFLRNSWQEEPTANVLMCSSRLTVQGQWQRARLKNNTLIDWLIDW